MGVIYDLILALRSQIFEYLRETFYVQTCLEPARSEKKSRFIPTGTDDFYWPFITPLVGWDTFSPLALALGPQPKSWLCYPLPLFTVVGMIYFEVVNMSLSSRYLQAAIAADKIWGVQLEPARFCLFISLLPSDLLRGATLIRTHDGYKNPYTPLFLHTIVGPDYYIPP